MFDEQDAAGTASDRAVRPAAVDPGRVGASPDRYTMTALDNGDTSQVRAYTPNVPPSNEFIRPDPGMSFAAVDVEPCAGEANPTGVASTFDFELQMPDNTRMDAAFMGAKEPELKTSAQAPGDCIRGWVTFEVPTGVKPAAVVFSQYGTSVKWNIP